MQWLPKWRARFILAELVLVLCAGHANAAVYIDDRAGFDAALTGNPGETIIDDNNAFAPDPSASGNIAVVNRSGTINGNNYVYDIYDVDFSNTPNGTITPGVVGGDIYDLDTLRIETPVSQGTATGSGSWGVDSRWGNTRTRNALLFDFTTTPGTQGIGHFGVELHDTESYASGQLAEYHVYRNGIMITWGTIDWGPGNDGNNESHFFGYVAEETAGFFDHIAIVVGGNPNGNYMSLAGDRFTFGAAYMAIDSGDAAGYAAAQHVRTVNAPYLGATAGDADPFTIPRTNAAATADDDNGINDEDGVSFSSPGGGVDSITATVSVTNPSGAAVQLCGWMDVDLSGTFDSGERQCNTAVNPGTSFTWAVSSAAQQDYYARFRVCPNGVSCDAPSGSITGGEVEDYRVTYSPTSATIGKVELEAVSTAAFIAFLDTDQMNTAALLKLLEGFDPNLAAGLTGADKKTLLAALTQSLDPDGDGQVALLKWDTLEERGTIGFYVKRSTGNNKWTLVNNDMLPGLINAPMGGEYLLADPSARAGTQYQYVLIEQEATGKTRQYGPFTLEVK